MGLLELCLLFTHILISWATFCDTWTCLGNKAYCRNMAIDYLQSVTIPQNRITHLDLRSCDPATRPGELTNTLNRIFPNLKHWTSQDCIPYVVHVFQQN